MHVARSMYPSRAAARWAWLRHALTALTLGLALTCAASVATARADVALGQWQPSAGDVTRTSRPCPAGGQANRPPVCWSVREDPSAWMALPPGSGYPWGQCTYYAGLMRPDIWNDRAPAPADPGNDWDAWTWVHHARAEGLPVDGNPRPGDVMVYSRRAAGNDTGHVAIVDAVGGRDRATGDLLITISEMNAEGLDDPAKGQGDTLTLAVPRSRLVARMIQFIHHAPSGYDAPVWPFGAGDAAPATTTQSATSPSLVVGLYAGRLATASESTAPEHVVVTSLSTGRTAKTLRLAANRVTALHLSAGRYRVCVDQAARVGWTPASACVKESTSGRG